MLVDEGAWCFVGVRPSLYLPREPRTELESELNSESRVFRLGCQPISRVTLPPLTVSPWLLAMLFLLLALLYRQIYRHTPIYI